MNVYSSRTLQLTVLCLALCAAGFAASDASLYVVHGIPGRDVAATLNPSLPVDVLLNDDVCYFKGLIFGSSSGPLTLPAGNYDIKISSANSLAPCTNPVLAETSAVLSPGSATTVVAALNANGAPALLSLNDNLNPVKAGYARFTFAHAADANTLQITLTQELVKNPKPRTFTINSGQEVIVDLPVGTYSLQATVSGGTTPFLSETVFASNQSVEWMYFVGAASNSSLSVVSRLTRDVF